MRMTASCPVIVDRVYKLKSFSFQGKCIHFLQGNITCMNCKCGFTIGEDGRTYLLTKSYFMISEEYRI